MDTFFPLQVRTVTGLEKILAEELIAVGAQKVQPQNRVVLCHGDLAVLYRANLWCRTAIRVLRPLASFSAKDEKSLYDGVKRIPWSHWMSSEGTLAVDANIHSSFTTHSLYVAQLVKDAVVDSFREMTGNRPSVDLQSPDLRISVSLYQGTAQIGVDASGESLHKRGYRKKAGEAPLSETLAAGIVKLAGWDGKKPLLNPMCGSGTIAIEAGLILKNIAPGLLRRQFGFQQWPDFNRDLYESLVSEAKKAIRPQVMCPVVGIEMDAEVALIARENVERAGLSGVVRIERGDFFQWDRKPEEPGILLMNPPYDERLPVDNVAELYQKIGTKLKEQYVDWKAYLLTGNLDAVKYVGLRSSKKIFLYNGSIECRLLEYELHQGGKAIAPPKPSVQEAVPPKWKEKAELLANRLRKNYKHFSKWAKRDGVTCWRLYDWDIPELAFLIDCYADRLHFAEIERNYDHSPLDHSRYMQLMVDTAAEVTGTAKDKVYFKRRKPQKGGKFQYAPHAETGDFFEVTEGGHRFWVNLADYLDVGLFLDHRKTRAMVQKEAKGTDMLNLFAYTGSFSVYAAAGGAKTTTTVDTSKTYLAWAENNLELNGFTGKAHRFIRSDSLEYLQRTKDFFDLIVVDPPTRSVNRSSGRVFEVQEDHVELLQRVLDRTRLNGKVFFSTNYRTFQLDESRLKEGRNLSVKEITSQTIPPDFAHKPSHRCWIIEKLG